MGCGVHLTGAYKPSGFSKSNSLLNHRICARGSYPLLCLIRVLDTQYLSNVHASCNCGFSDRIFVVLLSLSSFKFRCFLTSLSSPMIGLFK